MIANLRYVLPLLAAALLAGCSSQGATSEESAEAAPASLTVSVEAVAEGSLTTTVSATGNVTARQMVLVSAELSGLAIKAVSAAEGDLVKEGQVLAQLDTDQLKTQIDQQIAANRGLKASLDVAQLAFDRAGKLSLEGNLSTSDLQSRQSALDTARSALEQGDAGLKVLQLQLDQGTITAPVDGRLVTASPAVGQLAQAGATLFSIIEDDDLEVQAEVPEQILGRIKEQQSVAVTATDGTTIGGTVRAIAQQVDAATRLGIVYVSLQEANGFRVGMSARVTFETTLAGVLTVPEAALAWRDGQPGVFVVDPAAKVHFIQVETGDRENGRVVILGGVAAGQDIAIDGVGFLNDGMQVRVAEAAAS